MTRFQLVKKFPAFYGTRIHIHKSPPPVPILSQVHSVHAPIPLLERSFSILSSHLRRGLPSGLFPSCFPSKSLHTPLLSPICATWPAHLMLLDLMIRIIFDEEYRSLSSLLCSFLHSPVTSSLLGPNILLCTLFSKTVSLRSCLNVNDPVAYP